MTQDVQKEADQQRNEASQMLAVARDFSIQTRDDLAIVAEMLADIKGRAKRLEERKKEITGPLNAALKSARDLFRPAEEAFAQIEAAAKGKIAAFTADEERRNREALAAAAAAHACGDARGTQEALAQVATTKNVAGLSTYQKWDYEVVNEALLPREFLTANLTLIKEHASHSTKGDPTPIPGVRFFPRVVVTSRST